MRQGENLCCSPAVWPAESLALTEALCWWWGVWSAPCAFETPAAARQQTSIHRHIGWISTIHKHWYTVLYSTGLNRVFHYLLWVVLHVSDVALQSAGDFLLWRRHQALKLSHRCPPKRLKKEQIRNRVIINFKPIQVKQAQKYLEFDPTSV